MLDNVIAIDTEDDSKNNVNIIDFFDGRSHTTFTGVDCQEKAITYLYNMSVKPSPVFIFACNIEYDLINVFDCFYTRCLELTYTPCGLIRARWGSITFYDTLHHWELSVAAMGKKIGVPKLKPKGGKHSKDVDYCRRDAEIVWKFTKLMLSTYDRIGLPLKSTIAASGFHFWYNNFCSVPIHLNPDHRRLVRGSMYGGRCEIFTYGEVKQKVYDYDINSSYAFCMKESSFPNLHSGKVYHQLPADLGAIPGVSLVAVKHRRDYLGYLPYRYKGKLFFPTGSFWGVWTNLELDYAIRSGRVEVTSVGYVLCFDSCLNPFASYVDYVYQRRLATEDKHMKYVFKQLLNCVYGKFAERGEMEIWKKGKVGIKNTAPFWSNIIFSSIINSHARIRLLRYLEDAKDCLCYCDTDGLVVTSPRFHSSVDLGALKLQGTYNKAIFILSKVYRLGRKAKAKGIPQKLANQFIESGRIFYDMPVSYRQAFQQHLKANLWVRREQRLLQSYDKRKVLQTNKTKPQEIRHVNPARAGAFQG